MSGVHDSLRESDIRDLTGLCSLNGYCTSHIAN